MPRRCCQPDRRASAPMRAAPVRRHAHEETPVGKPTDAPLDWREAADAPRHVVRRARTLLREFADALRRHYYNDPWIEDLTDDDEEGMPVFRAHYAAIVSFDDRMDAWEAAHPDADAVAVATTTCATSPSAARASAQCHEASEDALARTRCRVDRGARRSGRAAAAARGAPAPAPCAPPPAVAPCRSPCRRRAQRRSSTRRRRRANARAAAAPAAARSRAPEPERSDEVLERTAAPRAAGRAIARLRSGGRRRGVANRDACAPRSTRRERERRADGPRRRS